MKGHLDTLSVELVTGGTRGLRLDAEIVAELLAGSYPATIHVSRQRNLHLLHRRLLLRALRTVAQRRGLSVFFEILPAEWLEASAHNVLIPNQEWVRPEVEKNLSRCTEIWCKTRYAEKIFGDLGLPVRYIGFSSRDQYLPEVPKDHEQFLHLAGRSHLKGTRAVLEVWGRHPEWPKLTVILHNKDFSVRRADNIEIVTEFLSEDALRTLLNRSAVHLCPSETEGYGHYIAEAMSTKAVVVTVDAPPMNELVSADTGIMVTYRSVASQSYSQRFLVDPAHLEAQILHVLGMSSDQKRAMGEKAREAFLARRKDFSCELLAAVKRIADREMGLV